MEESHQWTYGNCPRAPTPPTSWRNAVVAEEAEEGEVAAAAAAVVNLQGEVGDALVVPEGKNLSPSSFTEGGESQLVLPPLIRP